VKPGVLVVDKPRGMTSHDVVQVLRRALKTREVGHAGTLDPMATGVLVVAIGEATKLVPYLTAADKSYLATIALGVGTDSLDADGTPIETRPPPAGWQGQLEAALAAERARVLQAPPIFSAIRKGGVRSYEAARRGETLDLPPRAVRVIDLRVIATHEDPPAIDIEVTAAKGYYVRSLARDLAAGVGAAGHLTALRRTSSGSFTLDDAAPLDAPDLATRLLPLVTAAARALPLVQLTTLATIDARAGRAVDPSAFTPPLGEGPHGWLDPEGALVAVGALDHGVGRVLRGFRATAMLLIAIAIALAGCTRKTPDAVKPTLESHRATAIKVAEGAAKACPATKARALGPNPAGEPPPPPNPAQGTALESDEMVYDVFITCSWPDPHDASISAGTGLPSLKGNKHVRMITVPLPQDSVETPCRKSPNDCEEVLTPSRYSVQKASADLRVVRPTEGGGQAEVIVVFATR
jgi:tRNA pseudouridine55 synthase